MIINDVDGQQSQKLIYIYNSFGDRLSLLHVLHVLELLQVVQNHIGGEYANRRSATEHFFKKVVKVV